MQNNGLIGEQCTVLYSGILEVLGDRQADRKERTISQVRAYHTQIHTLLSGSPLNYMMGD